MPYNFVPFFSSFYQGNLSFYSLPVLQKKGEKLKNSTMPQNEWTKYRHLEQKPFIKVPCNLMTGFWLKHQHLVFLFFCRVLPSNILFNIQTAYATLQFYTSKGNKMRLLRWSTPRVNALKTWPDGNLVPRGPTSVTQGMRLARWVCGR